MSKYLSALFALLTGALLCIPSRAAADGMPAVIINELMWMGSSASSSDEWLELRNTTASPVDIGGWKITKLSNGIESAMLTIPSGTIPAGGFFVIANDPAATSRLAAEPHLVDSSISLVNSKLQVTLYTAANVLMDRADDGSGAPLAGEYASGAAWKSMERNVAGADGTVKESWHTSSASQGFDDTDKEWGTPGGENSNLPPVIVANAPESISINETAYFDGSESSDPENDPLTLRWDFGDGASADGATAEHRYGAAGSYTIGVTASDGRAASKQELHILITAVPTIPTAPPASKLTPSADVLPAPTSPSHPPSTEGPLSPTPQTSLSIRMNEVLPDPDGSDEAGEFLELINIGTTPVDLRGWKITDKKSAYRFAESRMLQPKELMVLPRTDMRIALLNSGGQELFLVDPFQKVIHGVKIPKAQTGRSFSRTDGNNWQWTDPTPGTANIFVGDAEALISAPKDAKGATFRPSSIAETVRLALRTKVIFRGTVTVPPGTLSDTFFYVQDGGRGIQIFSSNGTFPELQNGDVVEVRGTIGTSAGERKVNVSSSDAVTVVDQADEPEPVPFRADLPSGILTTLDGTVKAKRGSSLDVSIGETVVRLGFPRSADIDRTDFTVGDSMHVTGLWRVNKDSGKLYPRSQEDIESRGEVKAATVDLSPSIQSAQAKEVAIDSSPQNDPSPYLSYGVPALLLGMAAAAYWWWKRRKGSA